MDNRQALIAIATLFMLSFALPTDAHAACKTGWQLYDAGQEFWLDWLDNPAMDFNYVSSDWSNCSPYAMEIWESVLPGYHASFQLKNGTGCSGSTSMQNYVNYWNGSSWVNYGRFICNCPSSTTVCNWN